MTVKPNMADTTLDMSKKLMQAAANPESFAVTAQPDLSLLNNDVPSPSEVTLLMNKELQEGEPAASSSSPPRSPPPPPRSPPPKSPPASPPPSSPPRVVEEDERHAPPEPEYYQPTVEDEATEKASILNDLEDLKRRHGVRLSRPMTMEDSLSDLQYEMKKHLLVLDRDRGVKFMKDALKVGASALVGANDRFGPFLHLDGWAQAFSAEIENYDQALGSLYKKYWSRRGQSMSPEAQLAFGIGSSMAMHHFKNKFAGGGGMPSWIGGMGGAAAPRAQPSSRPAAAAAAAANVAPPAEAPPATMAAPSVIRGNKQRPTITFPTSAKARSSLL